MVVIDIAIVLLWVGLVGAVGSAVVGERARGCLVVAALASVVACAVLGRALWTLDLSVSYVADHARSSAGGPYRLAGLWGGASGSLLMFTSMVAVVAAALSFAGSLTRTTARWGGATVAALISAVIAFANPFRRLRIPAIDGAGLQPILEHPAMLYHPPLLYAGLVSTIVPWMMALNSRHEPAWRRRMRPALGVCLALLTVGQATGSNWAYVELGWGGFWGWDPVENGVLVAWLCVVMALHSIGQPGHDRLVAWACATPWLGVLVCTTVTRAGIGESVHAFADDDRVSAVLLSLIAGTVLVTAVVLAPLESQSTRIRWLPFVAACSAIVGAAIVLEGVLYPLVEPGDVVVSGHFYATVLGPIALVALAASSLALARNPALESLGGRSWGWWPSGLVVGAGLGALFGARTPFALVTAAAVGAVVAGLVVGLMRTVRQGWTMRIGHVGFALLLIGVAGSTHAERATVSLVAGDAIELGGVRLTHQSVDVVAGPAGRSNTVSASIRVSAPADPDGGVVLRPALVAFTDRSVVLAETALDSQPRRDVQVVLRTASDDGVARYDVSVTPLVQAVWWGSALLVLAGVLVVGDYFRLRSRSARARSRSAAIVADSASMSACAMSASRAASSATAAD